MMSFILTFCLAILILFLFSKNKFSKKFPPGPKGFPIVGNYLQLGPCRHVTFMKWGELYGPILGLQLGPTRVVVLNNFRHIREAFSLMPFNGRPLNAVVNVKDRNFGGMHGITFNEGPRWLEQRRFALRHLRDFGFGQRSMESLIMPEVTELIGTLTSSLGQSISTPGRFNAAVLNGLWSIVCGHRFDHDDPTLLDILDTLNSLMTAPTKLTVWGQYFPQVQLFEKLFPAIFPSQVKKFACKAYALFQKTIEEHKETFQANAPRDFLDVFLQEMATTHDSLSSFYRHEGEKSLDVTILDLFVAGNETVSSTLVWTFLLLASHKKTQDKLWREISKTVESSRHVSLVDRPKLQYLDATILEVLRYSAMTPLGLAHRMTETVTFHGFEIPKGTIIIPNLYAASRDKTAWGEDVDQFKPERFLSNENGQLTLVRNEASLSFSCGKRICPAENLAKDQLFLYIGNLVQRFHIGLLKTETSETGQRPLIQNRAPPHKIILTDRAINKILIT